MENKKLSFAVDASQIDIKPLLKKEFLELTMRAISTANPNRKNSWFTKESLEASIGSFKNKPILGFFENGDFVSHNGEWKEDPETQLDYWDTLTGKGERPIGMIRETDTVEIIDDSVTGLSWVVLTCALWTQYNYKQVKRLLKDAKKAKEEGGPTKNISVEVDITDYEYLPNGVMKINAFNLVGITILGSRNGVKVEPGIEGAELSVVDIMGTALYEKQMQSLRLAYEKLGGSETNKEDFSKMENNIQENSTAVQETIAPTNADVDSNTSNIDTNVLENTAEGSQEAHFENTPKNEEPNTENDEQSSKDIHQNMEDDGQQGVIRDVAWLISDISWNIESYGYSIEYYEAHEEIEGRDYILPVLKRLKAQAEENEKELSGLMAKVAEGISEEEVQFAEELCGHCDCKAEYTAYKELESRCEGLSAECESLKAAKSELDCKFAEIEKAEAHAKFMKEAEVVIESARFENDIAALFTKDCEEGKINTVDELKIQIGLKLFEIKSNETVAPTATEQPKVETPVEQFAAPVNKPDTNSFREEGTTKKGDKWDVLREYNKK